jgi:uncharacterized membrane protein SirB2
MSPTFYSILHVFSVVLLAGITFAAFANPDPARRKATLIGSGVLSLLVLIGGMGLLAKLGYGWPAWAFGKLACWLALSAMAGIAFRKPSAIGALKALTVALVAIAIVLVYTKPAV